MKRLCPVLPKLHQHRRWQRFSSHQFASADSVAALVSHELAKACTCLPLAFIWQGEQFMPVAVQGIERDKNLFVAPDGRWLGRYTPAGYRSYPFALGAADAGQMVLCVDEDSGLLSDATSQEVGQGTASEQLRFFDDEGQPDGSVREILGFLEQIQASRAQTERSCAALADEALLVPWQPVVQAPGGQRQLEGLFRVDEHKLQALPADALHRLHQAGALSMAYCQLVSMQHIQLLATLAQLHHAAAQLARGEDVQRAAADLGPGLPGRSGTIRFDAYSGLPVTA